MRRPVRSAICGAILPLLLASCRDIPASPLERAAAEGRTADLESLLTREASPYERTSALVWAARTGQIDALHVLLTRGADPNATVGVNDWPALMHAIHKNQNATALALLDAKPAPDQATLDSALIMAAGYGNEPMVRALLERGADPRVRGSDGATALSNAVGGAFDIDYRWSGCEPHTAVVRALLEKVPDLRLSNDAWSKLARLQARRRHCSEMLQLLEQARSKSDSRG